MTVRVAISGYELFGERTARSLRAAGVAAEVMPKSDTGTLRKRLSTYRFLLSSDIVFVIGGRRRLARLERVLVRCGLPVVIHWMGSDVLDWKAGDKDIMRGVWNVTEAPWLIQELEAGGLSGVELAPWTCVDMPDVIPDFSQPFTVVAYMPQARLDFYGIAFIVELARRLGDVQFELVATTQTEGLPPNVRTLGWVEDIDAVYRRATLLVRPVMHDGLANMVIEALAYGRYVLWSYEMTGVERITTLDAAETFIKELAEQSLTATLRPNLAGRALVEKEHDLGLIVAQTKERLEAIARLRWRQPPGRVGRALADGLLALTRTILLVPRRSRPNEQI